MSEIFKGFEDLLKLAQVLEEKAAKGELKTEVQFSSRPFSSIPRTGNIPRSPGSARSAGGSPSRRGSSRSRHTKTTARRG